MKEAAKLTKAFLELLVLGEVEYPLGNLMFGKV